MSLKARIISAIERDGPMLVSQYMQLCLYDPAEGYYAQRPGIGRDFTTAPEISQIFGELLGLWCVHEWDALNRPTPFSLVEIGPGRAVLMQDALRAMSQSATGRACLNALNLHLIEASESLRRLQREALSDFSPRFHKELGDLPAQPTLILANELLDCLPARQFVQNENRKWQERCIGLNDMGELAMGNSDEILPGIAFPSGQSAIEIQPGLETFTLNLAALAENGHPLRALVLDYGPSDKAPEDSLRAYYKGEQVHPLARPGESDLTVDVDFTALTCHARSAHLSVAGPSQQGQFLLALGAEARMQQLTHANPALAETIYEAAARLIDPAQMGKRFKAVCLSSEGLSPPAGF